MGLQYPNNIDVMTLYNTINNRESSVITKVIAKYDYVYNLIDCGYYYIASRNDDSYYLRL